MNISCNLDLKYPQSTAVQGLHSIIDVPFILHFLRSPLIFPFHWRSQSIFSKIVEQNPLLQHVLQVGTTHITDDNSPQTGILSLLDSAKS